MDPLDREHDVPLDLMRFAAAALVVLYHLIPVATLEAGGNGSVGGKAIWFGWIGVQLFFVISGYVIAHSASRGSARDFLRRRVLRLAPTAWICASFTAVALLVSATLPWTAIARRWVFAALFVPAPLPIDGVYWTLSVEVVFYLLMAVLLAGVTQRERRIERIGVVLGCASTAFWVGAYVFARSPAALLRDIPLRLTLLPHGAFFALGILLRRVRASGITPVRLAAIVTCFGGALLQIAAMSVRIGTEWGVRGHALVPSAVFIAGVAIVAASGRLQPFLKMWTLTRTATLLGLMTYPLYLLHHIIGLTIALTLIGAGLSGPVGVTIAATGMLMLSWYVTVRLEPPLRAGLAVWLNSRRAATPDMRRSASLPTG